MLYQYALTLLIPVKKAGAAVANRRKRLTKLKRTTS